MKFLSDWNSLIVGKTSPWLNLDSPNETVRKNSERVGPCLVFLKLTLLINYLLQLPGHFRFNIKHVFCQVLQIVLLVSLIINQEACKV